MWQGTKYARESGPYRVLHRVTHDSHGWPRKSPTLTVAFPARILSWVLSYLSKGKGSLSSKLQSLCLPEKLEKI